MKKFKLSNQVEMPAIGFGTWLIKDEEAADAVKTALQTGYTMIDTASYYKNECGVGKGIEAGNISRGDIFLTSKLWNDDHGYENTLNAFEKTLDRLQTEYLDLYLVHWPVPATKRNEWESDITDTWRAMEKIYESGKVKAIGVSNFLPHHLECIKNNCKIIPMVNQIEYHVSFMQEETVKYCSENNILVQAWSPLARGGVFELENLQNIADKYGKTVAQICLIWEIQKGIVPIPKTLSADRMKENLNVFDVELSEEDMKIIDGINNCSNSGHHPDKIAF